MKILHVATWGLPQDFRPANSEISVNLPSDYTARKLEVVIVPQQGAFLKFWFEADQNFVVVEKTWKLMFQPGEAVDGLKFIAGVEFGQVSAMVYEKSANIIIGG